MTTYFTGAEIQYINYCQGRQEIGFSRLSFRLMLKIAISVIVIPYLL